MKKTKRWIANILIILMILVGLGLVFNKSIRNILMANKINSYQVSNYDAKTLAANKKKKANYDFKQVQSVDFNSVANAQAAQNYPVIGGLAIPDVKINLPIFNGLDSNLLLFGAGTMKDETMGQGNYSLASHHVFGMAGASDLLFSPLTNAKTGMKIYLTDKTNVYEYTIDNIYTVQPEDVAVIDDHEGVKEVTLVTCTDAEASARIIVHGTLSKTYPFSKASKTVISAFEMKYNQFQS
ncbi:MAG: class A sortase [Streptococcaceae bacterium]|jgi:sortase A|nr:class A sortase [Streptococcaceae bacterium]